MYISLWLEDCTVAEAVSHWPVNMGAQIWFQVGRRGICGEQSGDGKGFSVTVSVFLCQYHSSNAPYISFVSYQCYVTSEVDRIIK